MKVGVPTEVKKDEYRVALTPAGVRELVDAGHSVVIAEHDPHIAAVSDWVIDMGPGAGPDGGRVVAAGTPADVAASAGPTAPYLRPLIGMPA